MHWEIIIEIYAQACAETQGSNWVCGVLVDAKRPDAMAFYERLGFLSLETTSGELGDRPEPTPMFLSIQAIPMLLGKE